MPFTLIVTATPSFADYFFHIIFDAMPLTRLRRRSCPAHLRLLYVAACRFSSSYAFSLLLIFSSLLLFLTPFVYAEYTRAFAADIVTPCYAFHIRIRCCCRLPVTSPRLSPFFITFAITLDIYDIVIIKKYDATPVAAARRRVYAAVVYAVYINAAICYDTFCPSAMSPAPVAIDTPLRSRHYRLLMQKYYC